MSARKCNLIVDSCCDLPFSEVDRDGVFLIEFPYFFGDAESLDDLWQTSSARDFYDLMREGAQPHTAAASFEIVTQAFERATAGGAPAVYLSFSSGLSGHFDQVVIAYKAFMRAHPQAELHLVDTLCASTPEGLIVLEAIRRQEQGASAGELAAWAEQARYFATTFFMVDSLDALKRGGRIPASVAFAGTKLDMKPILTFSCDGTLSIKGFARGRNKGIKQLAALYRQGASAGPQASGVAGAPIVLSGGADAAPEDVDRLERLALGEQGDEGRPAFMRHSIGPVIGSHVGPGMMSIAFWGADRRAEGARRGRSARKAEREA